MGSQSQTRLKWLSMQRYRGSSAGKESACNEKDLGSIPGWGRSPGGGHGNPLEYSCLENPHGQRSLVGCSLQGPEESDMTERPSTGQHKQWWSNRPQIFWFFIEFFLVDGETQLKYDGSHFYPWLTLARPLSSEQAGVPGTNWGEDWGDTAWRLS